MKIFLLVLLIAIGAVVCQDQQQVGNVTQLSAADIQNNSNAQFLANFGAQSVAREATQAGDLPDGQYNISRIYSASQQQVQNGVNYYFDVEISNGLGNSTRATYTVFDEVDDDGDGNDQEVTSYTYERGPGLNNVVFGNGDLSDEVDFSDNQAFLGPDVIISEEDNELEWLGEAWLGEDELVSEVGNVGGYTLLSVDEFNNNKQAQDLLVFGLGDVIDQIIDRGDLDDDYPFDLAQVYGVWQQVVSGINYQYDVAVDNRRGTTGRILFVVYSQPWTQTERVTSYNYTITTVVRGAPVTYGANSEGLAADDAFDESDNDDDDDDGNVPGGYSSVDLSQAANDPQIQNAQNLGAQYVADQGIATGLLPDGQYNVSQVFDISQQVVNGINRRFDVELSNGQGTAVRAQYFVYSPPGNAQSTVNAYRFNT